MENKKTVPHTIPPPAVGLYYSMIALEGHYNICICIYIYRFV